MVKIRQKITTFLWFDRLPEEAMQYYASIIPNSKVLSVSHYADCSIRSHGTYTGPR